MNAFGKMISECWSFMVVMITAVYLLLHGLFVKQSNIWSIAGILSLESLLLWFTSKKSSFLTNLNYNYRPGATAGVYLGLLVPLALLGETLASKEFEIHTPEIWPSLASVGAVITRLNHGTGNMNKTFLLTIFLIACALLGLIFQWLTVLIVLSFLIAWIGIELVPKCLPKSFTLGEILVILQLSSVGINRLILAVFMKITLANEDMKLLWFVSTLIGAVLLATGVVYVTQSYTSLGSFLAVYVCVAIIALAFLHVCLEVNPVIWLISFLSASCVQIFLLATWLVLFFVTILWTLHEALTVNTGTPSKAQSCSSVTHPNQAQVVDEVKNINFETRKVFHLFIALVYIPGLMLDTHLLLLASLAAFGLFIIVEAARALRVPVLGESLDIILRMFVDERDQGHVYLTHIYLLAGLSMPLWLSHHLFTSRKAANEMYSGVLSLAVGDSVACVIGRRFGRVHFPESKKTVEGTIASMMAQLFLVMLADYFEIVHISNPTAVFMGVSLSSLLEAFTDQIDNLILPLLLYPVLCVS
ncbi:unnamed protein product [Lymnaea stagnalis]|uniref:dolichol kinase n=1 Tax=Lymnaea stagnalis TaxID=6523 RepID=A0AAV2HZ43_LYMST